MAREKAVTLPNSGNGTLALPDAQASGSVLATQVSAGLTSVKGDLLAEVAGIDALNIDDDGLGEVSQEDIKLPAKIFNAKMLGPGGDPIPANVFFDTVTESTAKELNLILVKTHKTNEWREFNDALQKNEIRCRSFDQVNGTMADGTERKCEGCPDAQWENVMGKDGTKKRTRRCGPVHNVFAVELETLQPCVIRFRRTSLPIIQQYISRHHYRRRPVRTPSGKIEMHNYPFFSFACKATLKMVGTKNPYAVPVLERGAVLPAELYQQGADACRYVNGALLRELTKVIDADVATDTDEVIDTSFDTDKMGSTGGGDGQDFAS